MDEADHAAIDLGDQGAGQALGQAGGPARRGGFLGQPIQNVLRHQAGVGGAPGGHVDVAEGRGVGRGGAADHSASWRANQAAAASVWSGKASGVGARTITSSAVSLLATKAGRSAPLNPRARPNTSTVPSGALRVQ